MKSTSTFTLLFILAYLAITGADELSDAFAASKSHHNLITAHLSKLYVPSSNEQLPLRYGRETKRKMEIKQVNGDDSEM